MSGKPVNKRYAVAELTGAVVFGIAAVLALISIVQGSGSSYSWLGLIMSAFFCITGAVLGLRHLAGKDDPSEL